MALDMKYLALANVYTNSFIPRKHLYEIVLNSVFNTHNIEARIR